LLAQNYRGRVDIAIGIIAKTNRCFCQTLFYRYLRWYICEGVVVSGQRKKKFLLA